MEKQMEKFKLNALEAKQMENLKGGSDRICSGATLCGCSCFYANNGGSSVEANSNANADCGLTSTQGDVVAVSGYDSDDTLHTDLPLSW